MRKNIIKVFCTLLIASMTLFLTSCTNQNAQNSKVNSEAGDESAKTTALDSNEDVIKTYITNFLKNGYSKYYIINDIKLEFRDQKVDDGKLEAIVFTTMNSNVIPKDPDTVPYIIEAREKR